MLLGVAGYTMICFMFNMLDELTPIFAAAPISRGGMSRNVAQHALKSHCAQIVHTAMHSAQCHCLG